VKITTVIFGINTAVKTPLCTKYNTMSQNEIKQTVHWEHKLRRAIDSNYQGQSSRSNTHTFN